MEQYEFEIRDRFVNEILTHAIEECDECTSKCVGSWYERGTYGFGVRRCQVNWCGSRCTVAELFRVSNIFFGENDLLFGDDTLPAPEETDAKVVIIKTESLEQEQKLLRLANMCGCEVKFFCMIRVNPTRKDVLYRFDPCGRSCRIIDEFGPNINVIPVKTRFAPTAA